MVVLVKIGALNLDTVKQTAHTVQRLPSMLILDGLILQHNKRE